VRERTNTKEVNGIKKSRLMILTLILLMVGCLTAGFTFATRTPEITVTINDEIVEFEVSPQIINGQTMVPLRVITTALGAAVSWDQSAQVINCVKGDQSIVMTMGSQVAMVNNEKYILKQEPININGTILVPIRVIADSFQATITWDQTFRHVAICEKGFVSQREPAYIHFIDVGQKNAIFISYKDYSVIIDAGDAKNGDDIVDYLEALNENTTDTTVASQPNSIITEGETITYENIIVDSLIDSKANYETETYQKYTASAALFGTKIIPSSDMTFKIDDRINLNIIEAGETDNDEANNVITMLTYDEVDVLLMGNKEKAGQNEIVSKIGTVDVFPVGTNKLTDAKYDFTVRKARPDIILISAGYGTANGEPATATLQNLLKNGFGSSETGSADSIIVKTDGKNVWVSNQERLTIENTGRK